IEHVKQDNVLWYDHLLNRLDLAMSKGLRRQSLKDKFLTFSPTMDINIDNKNDSSTTNNIDKNKETVETSPLNSSINSSTSTNSSTNSSSSRKKSFLSKLKFK